MAVPGYMSSEQKTLRKRIIGLVIAVVLIAAFVLIPPFEGLTEEGMASIGIFIGAIVLFVAQVAPLAVSCLTLMVLLPFFNITTLTQIWADFGGTSFFFVFFCFGVTGALSQTTIPMRISAWITRLSKGNPKVLVFGFTFAVCAMSGFLSNFATLIMFYGIVMMFLKLCGRRPGESNLGKCLMIALPAAAGTGGFISPAGSPGNLIALSLMEAQGATVTFLDWFLMCTPFALLICLFLCIALCILFKPEPLPAEAAQAVLDRRAELGPMDRKERSAIVIIAVTVLLWFASTWFPVLNTTVVAACAFFLMFMPGIDLMNWKAYVQEADWNLLFMVGSVAITMGCVNNTGAMTWVMNKLFSGLDGMPVVLVFLLVGFVIAALRVFIPTAPSVAAIFVPVLIGISQIIGGHMVALCMIPVFWSGAAMLLVYTEPIFIYTFGAGYYKAGDLFKAGIGPSLLMVVIIALTFPAWFALFGY